MCACRNPARSPINYIIATYGDGRLTLKASDPAFADYLFWLHFANGSLMPAMMVSLVLKMAGVTEQTPITQSLDARQDTAFALVEQRLSKVEWLAGDTFTTADIMTVFPLTTMRAFSGRDLSGSPNTRAYLARIGARPAYQRAMAKGDPGMVLLLD